MQPPSRTGRHIGNQIALQAEHQHLAFRVAEASVEFDQLGPLPGRHQLDEQDAPVRRPVGGYAREGRLHQAGANLLDEVERKDRRGRIGPHPARVGALVAVEGALVVLGPAEQHRRLAVAKREQRPDLALQEFFDDHARPGRPESAPKGVIDRRLSRCPIGCDHNALSGRQPIRLHNVGWLEMRQGRLG